MKEGYINYASLHLQLSRLEKKVSAKVRFCSCFKREQMTSMDSSSPQAKHASRMHCGHTAAATHSTGRMSDCPQTLSDRLKKGHSVTSCLLHTLARSSAETCNIQATQCFLKVCPKCQNFTLIFPPYLLHLGHSQTLLTFWHTKYYKMLNIWSSVFPILIFL